MKKTFGIVSMLMLVSFMVFAQGLQVPAGTGDVSVTDWLMLVFNSLGQFKGATTLLCVLMGVQLAMVAFRTTLTNFAGKFKLIIVLALSLVAGILGLKITTNLDWSACLFHSSSLAAFQVLFNQIYKQFFTPKGNA